MRLHELTQIKSRINTNSDSCKFEQNSCKFVLKGNRGSLLIEYAVLILVVVAAFCCAQTYLKRAFSGYCRKAGDVFGFGRQYEPNVSKVETHELELGIEDEEVD